MAEKLLAPVLLLVLTQAGYQLLSRQKFTTQVEARWPAAAECESDGECGSQQSCIDFQCKSSCSGCGINADCETGRDRAVCKCPQGYHGDPYSICTAECYSDRDCPSHSPACVYNACINPCTNACGVDAECNLRDLTPVCSCPKTHTGDPFNYCRPFEARDLCEPNPCGSDANCTPGHDRTGALRPVCSCPAGYTGNALVACNKSDTFSDLCEPNPCGRDAKCTPGHDRTGAERPVCTCPNGYTGDALVACDRAAPERNEGKCKLDSQCTGRLVCIGSQCVDPCLQPNRLCSTDVCMASCAVIYPPASDRQS